MDELEYAIETINGTPFEEFAMAFLRVEGYEVHESGISGKDGGWDAQVSADGQTGIAHASTRQDWKTKIREDADDVESLEEELDEEYDLFVFVTNQGITGAQELSIKQDIQEEYGWNVEIVHRQNILGELRTNHPELADQFFDYSVDDDRDHHAELVDLRDERIELVRERSDIADDLQDGAAVALHVIPNSVFSTDKTAISGDPPDLPVLWELTKSRSQARGKYMYSYKSPRLGEPWEAYGMFRNDGLYETVSAVGIFEHNGRRYLQGKSDGAALGLDATAVLTVEGALDILDAQGFAGTASISVSLLDANGTVLADGNRVLDNIPNHHQLHQECYTTELTAVPIGSENVVGEVEPVLSEIWRQLGWSNGTPHIEDGEWAGEDHYLSSEKIL